MTTRFYLPGSGSAAVQPAWSAGWEFVSAAAARRCATAKQNTAMSPLALDVANPEDTVDFGVARFVSDPLQAQAVAGSVKGQIRAAQGDPYDDLRSQLLIKIVSGDGVTLRGLLLDLDASSPIASEWSYARTNRRFPLGWTGSGAALSNVNALAGDRIVIEIGARTFDAYGYSRRATLQLGDSAAADLPEDETSQDDLNPWIEFSQTLNFQAPAAASIAPQEMTSYRRRRA